MDLYTDSDAIYEIIIQTVNLKSLKVKQITHF